MKTSITKIASSFIILLLLVSNLTAQEELVDRSLGFTLKLPPGFIANAELVQANPQIAHAFVYSDPENDERNIMLMIEKMRGTIGQERLETSMLPAGFQGRLFVTKWQGYDVDGIEVDEESHGLQFVTYNIQIPLKKFAIQVKLFSHVNNKADLDRYLPLVLDNLKGESNWQNSAAPVGTRDPDNNYGKLLLACAIVSIVVGIVLFYVISKRTNSGTVLALAVVIWIVGASLVGIESREGLMVSGSNAM